MSQPAKYLDPHALETLTGSKLRARAVIEGMLSGMHRNPHRGSSVEFAEYKEYVPGDELKYIDWRAYARVDRYYVKQFEDETNLRAYLMLDQSGSMAFSYGDVLSKYEYGATLCAAIAWLLLQQGDAPGLTLFTDTIGPVLQPRAKKSQLNDLCRVLDDATVAGKTDASMAFSRIAERLRARSMVVMVSDFIDMNDEAITLAQILRKRGMEVVCFHIMDRAEWTLPWEQVCLFEGMEGDGEETVEPDEIRAAYQAEVHKHLAHIERRCVQGDIEYFRSFTDEPVLDLVQAFVRLRERRRR